MKFRNKFLVEYKKGVFQFLEVAKYHVNNYVKIRLCNRCMNSNGDSLEGVE